MTGQDLISFLADTLVMTGALMLLVLAVRKPVGRWFGPQAAYALWALPMIRLVLPPLVLPTGLVPHPTLSGAEAATGLETVSAGAAAPLAMPVDTVVAPALAEPAWYSHIDWAAVLVAVWLSGAALFLLRRWVQYRAMRRDLLAGARRIGHSGSVRIVASPAVNAPVAFGVFDKVVALPDTFLADADSDASDLAIAHELAHHAGNDLAANFAVQPLFALHWFNPLGWMAWRALRSDQEAACDARVMAGCDREARASYGRLIASFAAGPRLALAAPMAGPLAGDKPILHRLRLLARPDRGSERAVMARSLFAALVIAVPATATVSYAAVETPQDAPLPPAPPAAAVPPAVPAAPEAPQPPAFSATPDVPEPPRSPQPPQPPVPPAPPAAPEGLDRQTRIEIRKTVTRDADQARAEGEQARAEGERMRADAERMAREAMARAPQVEQQVSADGKRRTIRIVTRTEDGKSHVEKLMTLDNSCPADSQEARSQASANGTQVAVRICTGKPASVARALRSARASIASDRNLDAEVRADILSDLDQQIAEADRN